jgi:hypothetical protein
MDVLSYASTHLEFPHETTANQFFTESQFESYRALGFEIAYKMFCYAERRRRLDTAAEAERPAIAIVRHRQEPPGILPPGLEYCAAIG